MGLIEKFESVKRRICCFFIFNVVRSLTFIEVTYFLSFHQRSYYLTIALSLSSLQKLSFLSFFGSAPFFKKKRVLLLVS